VTGGNPMSGSAGSGQELPLKGVRVLELAHIVAGPSAGLIMADLGAEITKVEHPSGGDTARNQGNGGTSFFSYNRNKRSLALDLGSEAGKEVFSRLVKRSDVVVDNYKPGALDRLGIGYDWGRTVNPRIIYCSIKGFLPGPNESRPLTDELAQMAGGLAYLTGFPGQPMRAGASIVDIGAATYGVLGVLAALYRREQTGIGEYIQSGLFETVVFWLNHYLARVQIRGEAPQPRGAGRESSMGKAMGWAVYQLFTTRDDRDVFIAVTSNRHWTRLCEVLGFKDWRDDPTFGSNRKRALHRKLLAERIEVAVREIEFDEICARLKAAEVPYAPVNTPVDLVDEPHLNGSDNWMRLNVPGRDGIKLPSLPMTIGTTRYEVRSGPPALGEHSDDVLSELGYSAAEIDTLKEARVVLRSDQMLDFDAGPD
jgi:crotonobetainyl-CoA:carnitine CoA-transferase CaiB-like acyl-CoA transferase